MPALIRMPTEGELVDNRYLLQRCLGRGGYGVVYLAREKATRRSVALKLLLPHALERRNLVARFAREARLASAIAHPNAVTVYAYGEHRWPDAAVGVPYLAMEHLEGETLQSWLGRVGRVEPDVAAWMLAQVLPALACAHRGGVIHRDIKPSNLFLCVPQRPGGEPTVKLLDFGLARAFDEEEREALTSTGATPGTAHYMSPEQAMGAVDLSPAVDVYALGCVAWHCVMGQAPYQGRSAVEISLQHVSHPLPPLHEAARHHPLADFIARCLAKEPRARYADADAALQALRAACGDAPGAGAWAALPPVEPSRAPQDEQGQRTLLEVQALPRGDDPFAATDLVARPRVPTPGAHQTRLLPAARDPRRGGGALLMALGALGALAALVTVLMALLSLTSSPSSPDPLAAPAAQAERPSPPPPPAALAAPEPAAPEPAPASPEPVVTAPAPVVTSPEPARRRARPVAAPSRPSPEPAPAPAPRPEPLKIQIWEPRKAP
jgi:serine/threonine protein kinase